MKAQIVQIEVSRPVHYPVTCVFLEAKLIVKRGDKFQTIRVQARDMPSYERYCKIIASVLRRMRR